MQLNPTGFKEDVVRNMISHHPHIPASLTKDSNSCEIKFNRLSRNHLTDPWWTKIEKGKMWLFEISDWGQPLSSIRSIHNWGLPIGGMDLLAKESESDRFLRWPKPWFLTIQFEQVSSGQTFLTIFLKSLLINQQIQKSWCYESCCVGVYFATTMDREIGTQLGGMPQRWCSVP